MKATFNASYEDARKVASCFPKDVHGSKILGTNGGEFVLAYSSDWLQNKRDVVIDLSTQSPNIYRCLEHGLNIGVEWEVGDHETNFGEHFYSLKDYTDVRGLMGDINYHIEFKSIRILDLESYEGIEVEGCTK